MHSRIAFVPLLRNQDIQTNSLCTQDLKPQRTSCQGSFTVRLSKVNSGLHACMITASNCMLAVHKAHLHGLLSHMPLSFKHVKLLSSVLGQSFERRGSVLERVHANVQIHNTMSQQRSLEDVGVKRTRQDADGGKDSKLTSNTQPPNKKTHTDSSDSKQNLILEQSKSKENQGSTSNVPTKDSQPSKEKEPKESTQQKSEQEPSKPESDPQPKQETADTADAKAPLSSSVPKPEGNSHLIFASTLLHTRLL